MQGGLGNEGAPRAVALRMNEFLLPFSAHFETYCLSTFKGRNKNLQPTTFAVYSNGSDPMPHFVLSWLLFKNSNFVSRLMVFSLKPNELAWLFHYRSLVMNASRLIGS